MITEKQKCIAEQVVYGDLKVLDQENELWTYAGLGLGELVEGDCALYDKDDNVQYDWTDEIKPILRPMSDLTKEIAHKGYNDGKPFIPIEELEPHFDTEMYEDDLANGIEPHLALEYATYTEHHFKVTDLLHQLHFDTRNLISTNEAIDANSLPVNPYDV